MSNPYKKCVRCEKRKKVVGKYKKAKYLEAERFTMLLSLDFVNRNLCEDCMQELMTYAIDSLYNKGLKK